MFLLFISNKLKTLTKELRKYKKGKNHYQNYFEFWKKLVGKTDSNRNSILLRIVKEE